MREPNWTIRLSLCGPYGEHFEYALPIDAWEASRLTHLSPPSEIDAMLGLVSFESTVEMIRRREWRKDVFDDACRRLGRLLGERMEDAEGWHDASRVEPNKRLLAGRKATPE